MKRKPYPGQIPQNVDKPLSGSNRRKVAESILKNFTYTLFTNMFLLPKIKRPFQWLRLVLTLIILTHEPVVI